MATEYLTTGEAAIEMGLSESRVKQFCQEGRLGRRIGRNWAIPAKSVAAFRQIARPTAPPRQTNGTAKAAVALGISRQRVVVLCQEGRLGRKSGRYWVITDSQIERFKELYW